MKTRDVFLAIVMVSFFFAGCNSTHVEDSWKAPELTKLSFKKIFVVAPSADGATRRNAEDTLVKQMPNVQVVPSYTMLPSKDDLTDKNRVAKLLKDNQIDGLVIMRMVSNDTEVNYIPGSPPMAYGSMWGYWGPSYGLSPYYYDPGTVTTDKIIGIETNVYDVASEKLVWSSLTKTTNPSNVQQLIAETVEAISQELKKQGLIP